MEGPEPVPPAPRYRGKAAEGAAGIKDKNLAALLTDHWDWTLSVSPVWATTMGDHRFDRELGESSERAIENRRAKKRIFLTKAKKLPRKGMSAADQVTLDLFIGELEASIQSEVCQFELWSVSASGNALSSVNSLPEMHKQETVADTKNLLARYRKIAKSFDDKSALMLKGVKAGLFANEQSVKLTVEMLDRELALPIEKWPLYKAVAAFPKTLKDSERESLAADFRKVIEERIKPAAMRYRDVIKNQVLPGARGKDKVGLIALPAGNECYAARIRNFLGSDEAASELHALGMSEITRINAEMSELGQELFGTSDLAQIVKRLREDKKLYFETEEQIIADAEKAVAAARAAIPKFFGILPKADVKVVAIPAYQAPYTTIAYYRQPHADGSKPGEYFINTYKPEVRPRFEMEVLAYHEAIPGHHLQIAISMERNALPAFRKHGGSTAFVEGWALYTERLANEMNLYSSALQRMGMLSYDAWRASRLVVDTGIHSMGWTRAQGEEFMLKHTALTKANIINEVDRYIGWPGQALAYKFGQLTIFRLRAEAKKKLGDKFDIKAFHDVVLKEGAVSLPVLKRNVEAWVEGLLGPA